MKKDLIQAILPELIANSEKAREKYLVNHPDATTYDHYMSINNLNLIFKWSRDLNVAYPHWNFSGYEERQQ